MSLKIADKDNGYALLKEQIRKFGKVSVKVGVPDTLRDDGIPNDEVGAIHEYGLGHVPQRSFLRSWVDAKESAIANWIERNVKPIFRGQDASDWPAKFGDYCVEGVRANIRSNIPPPLNLNTVERKGSDLALVDTEQLINSVTYEVERK